MPTAYIYRGTFEVRAGETLRYREIVPDGTISPEVTKTYAELAGSGSVAAASVSLTPTVAAPTLTGVQIGAIAGVSVSLQPTVSPAAVSGVQVGSVTAASVSLRPTVAAPSVTGVRVGSINAAAVSLQPTVTTGTLTGVVAQTGSINAAAVTCRPTVAVGTLTGVAASGPLTESFTNAGSTLPYVGTAGTWSAVNGVGGVSVSGGAMHIQYLLLDEELGEYGAEVVRLPLNRSAEKIRITARTNTSSSSLLTSFSDGAGFITHEFTTVNASETFELPSEPTSVGVRITIIAPSDSTIVSIEEIVWGAP